MADGLIYLLSSPLSVSPPFSCLFLTAERTCKALGSFSIPESPRLQKEKMGWSWAMAPQTLYGESLALISARLGDSRSQEMRVLLRDNGQTFSNMSCWISVSVATLFSRVSILCFSQRSRTFFGGKERRKAGSCTSDLCAFSLLISVSFSLFFFFNHSCVGERDIFVLHCVPHLWYCLPLGECSNYRYNPVSVIVFLVCTRAKGFH